MLRAKFKISNALIVYLSFIVFIALQVFLFIPSIRSNKWLSSGSSNNNLFFDDNSKKSYEQKMIGVHLLENSKTEKGWELYAAEASGSKNDDWTLKKVKVTFYSDDSSSFTVIGEVGEVDGFSKNMRIRGNVLTESSNGYSIETTELMYVSKEKKLFSTDAVVLRGPPDKDGSGLFLNGQTLEIKILENKISILNSVQANKMVDNKLFKINSTSSTFSNKDKEALFYGNVRILYDNMKISSPYAEFKYSSQKNALETVQVYDDVILTDKTKTATCREMLINIPNDTMILKGNPRIKMGEDEIQGDEVIFSEKGKKIKINQLQFKRKDDLKK